MTTMTDARSSYGEWCPTCGAGIVSVTRGIPSMGTCSNGHVTDRRDTLRRPPADPVATELAALRKELADALDLLAKRDAELARLREALDLCVGLARDLGMTDMEEAAIRDRA